MTPSNEEIDFVFRYIQELCGNALDSSRSYLIESRLSRIAAKFKCNSYRELIEQAKHPSGISIRTAIIDSITTQETHFFRDSSPFQALQFKLLPELIDQKSRSSSNRTLRIWSAACSHGQEPYSISMILHELLPDVHQWRISITATDISDSAIAKSSLGVYSDLEIERGLPTNLRKYFSRVNGSYKINDSVRALIQFKQLNLLEPFPFNQLFDIVLCRNVAIYFSKPDKIDLFRRIMNVLTPEGHLIAGASESLFDCGPEFRPKNHCGAMVYQPNLTASTLPKPMPATASALPVAPTTAPSKPFSSPTQGSHSASANLTTPSPISPDSSSLKFNQSNPSFPNSSSVSATPSKMPAPGAPVASKTPFLASPTTGGITATSVLKPITTATIPSRATEAKFGGVLPKTAPSAKETLPPSNPATTSSSGTFRSASVTQTINNNLNPTKPVPSPILRPSVTIVIPSTKK